MSCINFARSRATVTETRLSSGFSTGLSFASFAGPVVADRRSGSKRNRGGRSLRPAPPERFWRRSSCASASGRAVGFSGLGHRWLKIELVVPLRMRTKVSPFSKRIRPKLDINIQF